MQLDRYQNKRLANKGMKTKEEHSGVDCPGFAWNRVNFLPTSWCSAMFWV